jgi:hypothetical protein
VKEYTINIDIYGSWHREPPVYRVYIDDEMICERPFLGMETEFYREKILVELDSGLHELRFEQLPMVHHRHILKTTNLQLNGQPIESRFTV